MEGSIIEKTIDANGDSFGAHSGSPIPMKHSANLSSENNPVVV